MCCSTTAAHPTSWSVTTTTAQARAWLILKPSPSILMARTESSPLHDLLQGAMGQRPVGRGPLGRADLRRVADGLDRRHRLCGGPQQDPRAVGEQGHDHRLLAADVHWLSAQAGGG